MSQVSKGPPGRAMRRAARAALAGFPLLAATLAQPALALEKVTFGIASTVIDVSQATNTSIPLQSGCWKDAGLDVDFQPTNSSAGIQGLLSGKIDFIATGPTTAIVARSKGADVVAVYLNIRKNIDFLVVPDESPIKSLRDFKGKSVGVFSYGWQGLRIFKGMIASVGLKPDTDVTWIETGAGGQAITALTTRQVDTWGTWDSQLATAENQGIKLRSYTTPQAEALDWGSSFFTTGAYASSHAETVGKVLRCIARSTAFALADPEAAVRAHWAQYPGTKPTNISEDEAMRQALRILNTRLKYIKIDPGAKWGEMSERSAQSMIDFMKQNGDLKGNVDVKAADLFTNRFVAAANDFDPASPLKIGR